MSDDRKPPFSEDAEQAVLSAMLLDQEAVLTVVEYVDAESFYLERHRRIFAAMMQLATTSSAIDPVTLCERLEAAGDLDRAGGKDYVGYLLDVAPSAENVAHHAAVVREKAECRALIKQIRMASDELWRGQIPSHQVVQSLLAELAPRASTSIGEGFVRVKNDIWAMLEDLEARQNDPNAAQKYMVPTGYPEIDEPLGGGIGRGEMMIIAAVPGGCKSAFASNIALNNAVPFDGDAAPARGVGFITAEMKRRKNHMRNLATLGRINYTVLRKARLVDDDFSKLARAAALLNAAPLWFDETPTPNYQDAIAKCRRLKKEHPELALVVVDFMQLVQARLGNDRRMRDSNRAQELTDITYAFQGMGKELDVAVVATAQVDAADVETRPDKMPKPGDLRWSQGMREGCDFLVTCYRPKMYAPEPMAEDLLEMMFWKARDAEPFRTALRWQGQYLLLTSPKTTAAQPRRSA